MDAQCYPTQASIVAFLKTHPAAHSRCKLKPQELSLVLQTGLILHGVILNSYFVFNAGVYKTEDFM